MANRRPTTTEDAILFIVERMPELRPLYEEHLRFNDELLPYVLFEGDFTVWLRDHVRSGDQGDAVARFLDVIEILMTTESQPPADDPVWNLAGVAFVESLVLGGEHDVLELIAPLVGPSTARDIEQMRSA